MASIPELTRYIRFQLSQLRPLNKHHAFEELARQFARLRICENILPATGPVGSGGDQGRDFETYRSYLTSTPIATSTFLGTARDKKIVFACSLQREILTKIKSDVRTICAGTDRIDHICYFCEADIPVARRHELQQWVHDEFNAELEIFDGQALSEQLTSLDIFWIAEEYLDVPAEMYPRVTGEPTTYATFKRYWLGENHPPYNYADFFQVKYGIRRATFHDDAKPDLRGWMIKMEAFLGEAYPHDLRRRAIYEICVAAFRGQNNLMAKKALVEEYFSEISTLHAIADIEDITVLLVYCSSAQLYCHFEIEAEKLFQWSKNLIERIEKSLDMAPGSGSLCRLLQIRGYAGLLPFQEDIVPRFSLDDTFKWWFRLVDEVQNAPLFPLEDLADLLCKVTTSIGEDPRFISLSNRVDELLSARASGRVAAEKSRQRAIAYFEAGKSLLAIKQLHQAKIKWFSLETLWDSLLAMLTLSDCYQNLGLIYAAKYYASIVAYLAFHQDQATIKPLLPQALFSLADCCYIAGEWLSFIHIGGLALGAHSLYDENPFDTQKHEHLLDFLTNAALIRVITRRFNPHLGNRMDEMFAQWPILHGSLADLENQLDDGHGYWQITPLASLWKDGQEQLSGRPFCDAGHKRLICWKALGIEWCVEFENKYLTTLISEEFVATLQVIIADIGREDLCLLPTKSKVQCFITDGSQFVIEEEPNNKSASWRVGFPKSWIQDPQYLDTLRNHICSLAVAILSRCSILSFEAFQNKLEGSFSEGLSLKIFTVRPYAELYAQFTPRHTFEAIEWRALSPLEPDRTFNTIEHSELRWVDGPGPGYSWEKAQEILINRYVNLIRPIRRTLPRLLQRDEFRALVRKLREEGYLDWQILLMISNMAVNHRVNILLGRSTSREGYIALLGELMHREETAEDIEIPHEIFTEEAFKIRKQIYLAAVAGTWDLVLHCHTPDLDALARLLDARYNNSADDIEHDDFFPNI